MEWFAVVGGLIVFAGVYFILKNFLPRATTVTLLGVGLHFVLGVQLFPAEHTAAYNQVIPIASSILLVIALIIAFVIDIFGWDDELNKSVKWL